MGMPHNPLKPKREMKAMGVNVPADVRFRLQQIAYLDGHGRLSVLINAALAEYVRGQMVRIEEAERAGRWGTPDKLAALREASYKGKSD